MDNEKILVTQSSIPELEEYVEEIKSIFETKWLTNMGEKHKKLEKELLDYLDVEQISLFTNGHMALVSAIKNMDLKGEVITTPFTFASTTHAIVQNGLTPVFCDINPQDYTIDVDKIESLITKDTCAILPVHVYGNICDTEKIEQIAKKYNLKVIYDAAHAFGEKIDGVGVGNFGDISMFSFHATKVFNTIEGGALTYKGEDLKRKIDFYKNFGINGPERVIDVGINSKMNELQAAMGICNLRHIAENIQKRKKIVERYRENLKDIDGIKLNDLKPNIEYNYSYFPVVFNQEVFGKSRDEVAEQLAEHNIFARKYFYPLTNDFECYKDKYNSEETPNAKVISNRVLTLPLYAELPIEQVDRICNIILKK